MRLTLVHLAAAAAPLALLAACGEATPVEEVEPEPMPTEAVPVTVDLPEIPVNSVLTINYPGAYLRGETRLSLNDDMTYVLTRPDGSTVTGTYDELQETNRIRLNNFDGSEPAYFAVGTGAIYELPSPTATYEEITVEGEFQRVPDTAAPEEPGATPAATAAPGATTTE